MQFKKIIFLINKRLQSRRPQKNEMLIFNENKYAFQETTFYKIKKSSIIFSMKECPK